MKTFILLLIALAFVIVSTIASAQSTKAWVQEQTLASRADGNLKLTPTVDMYAEKTIGSGFGAYGYGLVSKGFAEIYAGPTYSPAKWLQLGVGGGLQDSGGFRSGGFLWAGNSDAYLIGFGELNAKGEWWYKGIAAWTPAKYFGIGGFVQRFAGAGPYVEFKIQNPVMPVTLWAAPVLYDWEEVPGSRGKSLLGLRANF